MSTEELLRFCKRHNVKVTFSYDNDVGEYNIRMERDFFIVDRILTIEQIYSSSNFDFVIHMALNEMVSKLNSVYEKIFASENKEMEKAYDQT